MGLTLSLTRPPQLRQVERKVVGLTLSLTRPSQFCQVKRKTVGLTLSHAPLNFVK